MTLQANAFKLDGNPLKVQANAVGTEVAVGLEMVVAMWLVLLDVSGALLEIVEVRVEVVGL
jgi:hypothetical protein